MAEPTLAPGGPVKADAWLGGAAGMKRERESDAQRERERCAERRRRERERELSEEEEEKKKKKKLSRKFGRLCLYTLSCLSFTRVATALGATSSSSTEQISVRERN